LVGVGHRVAGPGPAALSSLAAIAIANFIDDKTKVIKNLPIAAAAAVAVAAVTVAAAAAAVSAAAAAVAVVTTAIASTTVATAAAAVATAAAAVATAAVARHDCVMDGVR
jgi:hypothetical protein